MLCVYIYIYTHIHIHLYIYIYIYTLLHLGRDEEVQALAVADAAHPVAALGVVPPGSVLYATKIYTPPPINVYSVYLK